MLLFAELSLLHFYLINRLANFLYLIKSVKTNNLIKIETDTINRNQFI